MFPKKFMKSFCLVYYAHFLITLPFLTEDKLHCESSLISDSKFYCLNKQDLALFDMVGMVYPEELRSITSEMSFTQWQWLAYVQTSTFRLKLPS